MKHKCVNVVRHVIRGLNRNHFAVVVFLSVIHIGLAATHPRTSGPANRSSAESPLRSTA